MMLSFTRTHAFSVLVNRLADIIFCSCLIYCRFFLVPCFFYLVMLFPTILLYFIPGWSGSAVFSVHPAPSQCDLVWHQGKVPRHRRRHQLQPGDGSWYSMIAGRMMGDDSSLKLVAPVHAPFLHFLALVLRRIATIIFVIRTHETLLQVGIGSAFLLGGFMATDAEGLATYFAVISSLSLVSQRRLVNIISMHAKRLQSCSLPLCVSRHCLKSTNHLDSSTL